jgi:tetratricopeptide (TPR) repeat protein
MLKKLLVILGCYASVSLYAQNDTRIDSLLPEVLKLSDDTVKVRKLLELAMSSFEVRSESALIAAQESETLAAKLNDSRLNIYIFGALAYRYYLDHNYPDALNYYFKGLHLAEEHNNNFLAARYNNYIGSIHHEEQNFILAKGFFYLAYSYAKKLNDDDSKAVRAILGNIGMIDMVLKNYEQGEVYLLKSIRLARKNNDELQEATALNHLGYAYRNRGQYKKALIYLHRSLDISRKHANERQLGYDYVGIGDVYYKLKKYDQAQAYYKLSMGIGLQVADMRLLSGTYEQMSGVAAAMGNYKDAYQYVLLFKQTTDSMFSEDKNRLIAEMNVKYETGKKDNEINKLVAENSFKEALAHKQTRIIYIVVGALCIFLILMFFLIKNVRQKNNAYRTLQEKNRLIDQQKKKIEMQKNILESHNSALQQENILAQFETLKNQVNPHFLFNCLAVLCSLIKKDAHQAYLFAKEFSNIYRIVLELKKNVLIYISEELAFVNSYLQLQSIRFNKNLIVNIHQQEEFINESFIPPFSLQLLLENAIKHNIISDKHPLYIEIYVEDDYLVVKNNIQGRSVAEVSTGIGNQNLLQRYKIICDKVPEFYSDGSYYYARIPILKNGI